MSALRRRHRFTTGLALLIPPVLGLLVLASRAHFSSTAQNASKGAKSPVLTIAKGPPRSVEAKTRWRPWANTMIFEPASADGSAFIHRSAGASLLVSPDGVVFALAKPAEAGRGRSARFRERGFASRPARSGLVLPGLLIRPGGTLDSQFRIENSKFTRPEPLTYRFVHLRPLGANPKAKVVALDKLTSISNYFIGNNPKKWRTNVPNYARVEIKDVYPGIDQIFYGKDGQLEYDFVVHPGADPRQIRLAVEAGSSRQDENGGIKPPLQFTANGDIVIPTEAGEVRLGKPVLYQHTCISIQQSCFDPELSRGRYELTAQNQISFRLPNYDRTRTLVIDPTLKFIDIFGGSNGAQSHAVAIDVAQSSYVAGYTNSTNFPTTSGSFEPAPPGPSGAFVRKVDSTGAVVYSTYLAGSGGDDIALGIAVDSSGDAFVTGETGDADFPVINAFQPTLAGADDAFVTELNAAGSALVYSSYLGGAANATTNVPQRGWAIAVDSTGNAYVTGQTASSDFPITTGAFQTAFTGGNCGTSTVPQPCDVAFVTKVAAGGSALLYSTFLGGSAGDYGDGIAVDATGSAYVVGLTHSLDFPTSNAFQPTCASFIAGGITYCLNAFVTELLPVGSALAFSTYLGGTGPDNEPHGVALDPGGNVYVAGNTTSTDFPTANALQPSNSSVGGGTVAGDDAFITEFSPGGTSLVYSTYLGGSSDDLSLGISVDSLGEAFVAGFTDSTDFPVSNAIQSAYGSVPTPGIQSYDAFVAGIQAGGTGLIYSTYLGDGGQTTTQAFGIAVDGKGDAWITGESDATSFTAAISRPEVVHRDVAPRALSSTSSVTNGLGGSILLDMARVSPAPSSLSFAPQVANTTSTPQTVAVSNPGTAPLAFSAITPSNSFSVASGGSCSTSGSVPVGGNCTVNVAFAPTMGGNLTGTLTLTDNGIGSPHKIELAGTGQDFALSTNQQSATVKAGGTATFTLSIAPQGGFNQTVSLSCALPAALALSTCKVSPTSVTPSGAGPATATVTVATSAAIATVPPSRERPFGEPFVPPGRNRSPVQFWLVALAMLLAVAAASRRRRHSRAGGNPWVPAFAGTTDQTGVFGRGTARRALTRFALALLLVLAWGACGGAPGTPPGTYTISLTATGAQASLTQTTTITLTVNP